MAKVDELDAARDACLALVELCGAFLLLVRDFYRWSDSAQEPLAMLDEFKHREYARAEPFLSLFVKIDNAQPLARQSFEKVRLSLMAVAADRCAHQQIIEQADTILKVAGPEFGIGGRIAERDAGRTLAGMMGAMLWPAWGRDAWPEIDVEAARQRIEVEHAKAIAPAALSSGAKLVDEANDARHSADFASVNWYGTPYTFTTNQAACVRVLWDAWKNKTPVLGGLTIIDAAGVDRSDERLDLVFRDNLAWGRMIFSPSKGRYCLKAPDAAT